MIPLRWHLAVLVAATALSSFITWWLADNGSDAAITAAFIAFVLLILTVLAFQRYWYFERFGLVTLRRRIGRAMRQHMRHSGVYLSGSYVYYHSEGRTTHRTYWPRLWVWEAAATQDFSPPETQCEVNVWVFWPRPFFGELLTHTRQACITRVPGGNLAFHPEAIAFREWTRLTAYDKEELRQLADQLQLIVTELEGLRERHTLGTKRGYRRPHAKR